MADSEIQKIKDLLDTGFITEDECKRRIAEISGDKPIPTAFRDSPLNRKRKKLLEELAQLELEQEELVISVREEAQRLKRQIDDEYESLELSKEEDLQRVKRTQKKRVELVALTDALKSQQAVMRSDLDKIADRKSFVQAAAEAGTPSTDCHEQMEKLTQMEAGLRQKIEDVSDQIHDSMHMVEELSRDLEDLEAGAAHSQKLAEAKIADLQDILKHKQCDWQDKREQLQQEIELVKEIIKDSEPTKAEEHDTIEQDVRWEQERTMSLLMEEEYKARAEQRKRAEQERLMLAREKERVTMEEEAEKMRLEDEYKKRLDVEQRRRQLEEESVKKRMEEEYHRKRLEDERRKKQMEEEFHKKRLEEESYKRRTEEHKLAQLEMMVARERELRMRMEEEVAMSKAKEEALVAELERLHTNDKGGSQRANEGESGRNNDQDEIAKKLDIQLSSCMRELEQLSDEQDKMEMTLKRAVVRKKEEQERLAELEDEIKTVVNRVEQLTKEERSLREQLDDIAEMSERMETQISLLREEQARLARK